MQSLNEPNHSARRINHLAKNLSASRYLEIGVRRGATFNAIDIATKVGVDPKFIFNFADYQSERVSFFETISDSYFVDQAASEKFDIIFLDGLHTFEQTFRDFCNALTCSHERTVVIIDDTVPSNVFSSMNDPQKARLARQKAGKIGGAWHGDVYKLIFLIHDFFPGLSYCTITSNGNPQTFVWRETRCTFKPVFNSLELISRLTYPEFKKRSTLLNMTNEDKGLEMISSAIRSA
jgi:hypothetical protein